ncbi:MAG TPA: hypothetical protein VGR57_03085 [Ktedonobacterales bacterium]|nr:hypothetical protein [Ktedonobacterales bacterium]
MFAQYGARVPRVRLARLDRRFSAAEVRRLADLRRRYVALQYREWGLDLHRLEFARWLARTGRLNEGPGVPIVRAPGGARHAAGSTPGVAARHAADRAGKAGAGVV